MSSRVSGVPISRGRVAIIWALETSAKEKPTFALGRCQSPEYGKPKAENGNRPIVYAVSLGCAKNLVDTEIMLGRLSKVGWQVAAAPDAAQLLW